MLTKTKTRLWLIYILVSVAVVWAGLIQVGRVLLFEPVKGNPITIVLRLDDYSSASDSALESKIFAVLKKHSTPCTFSVIPAVTAGDFHDGAAIDSIPLSESKVLELRGLIASGLIEVAQHGLTHQTAVGRDRQTISEFRGVPLEIQRRKILEGKRILEDVLGVGIQTFVPPWERYDENTLSATEDAGFTIFSASKKGVSRESDSLIYMPSSFALAGLHRAVNEASRIPDSTAVIIAVVHEYDFVDSLPRNDQLTIGQFDSTLAILNKREEVRFLTMSEAADVILNLDDTRQKAFSRYVKSPIHNLLPDFLENQLPRRVYVGADYAEKLLLWGWIWLFATGVAILVISTIAIALTASLLPRITRTVHVATLCAALGLLSVGTIAVLGDGEIYFNGLWLILLGTGTLSGGYFGLRVARSNHESTTLQRNSVFAK